MVDDLLDEGHLHMWGIGNADELVLVFGVEVDGEVVEDGEGNGAVAADDGDAVGACGFVCHEAPGGCSRDARMELEAGVDGVFHFVDASHVGAESFGFDDVAEHLLEEVDLVRCQVVEVAATACDVGLQAPRQVGAVVVEFAWWYGESYLAGEDFSDDAALDDFAHADEVGEIAAVVCHETRYAREFGDAVHAEAVVIAGGKRLFDIDGFACSHCHDCVGGMGGWWCGDVNGVDVGVVNECLCIGVELTDVVALCVRLCFFWVAAHDGNDLRAFYFSEGGSAFLFGYFTASDEAPFDCLEGVHGD